MAEDRPAIVEAVGIGRRFAGREVLADISFTLAPGELLGVVGPDGSGKTTLLEIVAAILRPTGGTCHVLGADVVKSASSVQSRIGYMSQGFSLYDRLTVAENIKFAADIRDVPPGRFEIRRQRLLAMAGLERFQQRREGALSGGMRKKLALCANLIHEPPLLILDEPSLGVDPLSRRELWTILDDAREQGRSIIFATSYMDEAEASDQVLLLRDGGILASGTPSELKRLASDRVVVARTTPGFREGSLVGRTDVLSFQKVAPNEYRLQLTGDVIPRVEAAEVGRTEPTMEDVFATMSAADVVVEALPAEASAGAMGAAAGDVSVEANHVTRRFGSFVAVDNVSLRVRSGEILGMLGPNGAGKTTLIRMLCGLLPPSSGSASIAGFDVAAQSEQVRTRIGYVSQKFSLFLDMTPAENLRFFARAYGVPRRDVEERIAWASQRAGLPALRNDLVGSLSGAIRQRLALACAIIHKPKVLFLDEPTSGVDPLSRFRFWRLISAVAAEGVTVLVSTHYLEEATYCDRLALMMDGRMIGLGPLTKLREELDLPAGKVEEVFLAFIARERRKAEAA